MSFKVPIPVELRLKKEKITGILRIGLNNRKISAQIHYVEMAVLFSYFIEHQEDNT